MSLCFPGVVNHLYDYGLTAYIEINSKLTRGKIYTVKSVGSEGG